MVAFFSVGLEALATIYIKSIILKADQLDMEIEIVDLPTY